MENALLLFAESNLPSKDIFQISFAIFHLKNGPPSQPATGCGHPKPAADS
jgi:hypothetical protein